MTTRAHAYTSCADLIMCLFVSILPFIDVTTHSSCDDIVTQTYCHGHAAVDAARGALSLSKAEAAAPLLVLLLAIAHAESSREQVPGRPTRASS